MLFVNILFYIFGAILVGAGIGVITSRNPVHSVLFLVFAFFNSAIIWLLMEAEFLAIVLMLVYVGAVMVLFLFVVMMLDINIEKIREGFTRYAPLGSVVALVVIGEIVSVVYVKALGLPAGTPSAPLPADYSNTRALGNLLYSDYIYPLQLAAVILLVAIVAAIVLTMRRRTGLKYQNVARQVAVQARDRVRIIKMDAEKRT
jgi:NADH-quinone oxidoreductase subunit J